MDRPNAKTYVGWILAALGIAALALAALATPVAADTRFVSPVTTDGEIPDLIATETDETDFVPEPGTIVLLGTGLAYLARMWRSKEE